MNKKFYILFLGLVISAIFSFLFMYFRIEKSHTEILNKINNIFLGNDNISDGDYNVVFLNNGKIDKEYTAIPFGGFNFINLKKYSNANLPIGKTSEELEKLNQSEFTMDSLSIVSVIYKGKNKEQLLNSDIKTLNTKLDKICETAYDFLIEDSKSNFQIGAYKKIADFGKITDNYYKLRRSKVIQDKDSRIRTVLMQDYSVLFSSDTIIYTLEKHKKNIIKDALFYFVLSFTIYYLFILIAYFIKKILK